MSLADEFAALDAAIAGDEPDYAIDPTPPSDEEHADRMLRHLARLQRERETVTDLAGAERERIDLWESGRLEKIDGQMAWFEQGLALWHAAVLRDSPKRKTISLPNGRHVARKQQPDWVYTDEAAFLAWAEENAPALVHRPEPVTPDPTPDKNAVKAALVLPSGRPGDRVRPMASVPAPPTDDGELEDDSEVLVEVPGIEVTIRGDGMTWEIT